MARELKTQWIKDIYNDVKYFLNWLQEFFTINLLVSLIIILLCIGTIIILSQNYEDVFWAKHLVIPICSAIIAGFCVSIVIDIRKQVKDIHRLIIKSFTESEYLKHLNDNEISELREKALDQLNSRKYPNMQKGLISKDNDVFKALISPYYSVYRETGVYKRKEKFSWEAGEPAESILFRHVTIEYTIESPKSCDEKTTADLGLKKTLDIPLHVKKPKDAKEIFIIKNFLVSIDGGNQIDIKNNIIYKTSKLRAIDNYYNTQIEVEYNGSDNIFRNLDGDKFGIFTDFATSVDVQIVYDVYLPPNDMHFTCRLKYPVKSFRIDCSCEDDKNVRFCGELLGSFTSAKQRKVTHAQPNMLSIESQDWLLPKNGVFVVMCIEKNIKNNKI